MCHWVPTSFLGGFSDRLRGVASDGRNVLVHGKLTSVSDVPGGSHAGENRGNPETSSSGTAAVFLGSTSFRRIEATPDFGFAFLFVWGSDEYRRDDFLYELSTNSRSQILRSGLVWCVHFERDPFPEYLYSTFLFAGVAVLALIFLSIVAPSGGKARFAALASNS